MTAKPKQDGTQKQQPQETPEDSFTAHILIEQALHLPTVPGRDGQRYLMTWLPVVSIQLWEKYELSFLRKGPVLNLASGTNLNMKHHCLHFILLCINSDYVFKILEVCTRLNICLQCEVLKGIWTLFWQNNAKCVRVLSDTCLCSTIMYFCGYVFNKPLLGISKNRKDKLLCSSNKGNLNDLLELCHPFYYLILIC